MRCTLTFLILITVSFLSIQCSGPEATESDIIESDTLNPNYCLCDELIFDERYNHYYRFVVREGFTGLCESFYPTGQLKLSKNLVEGKLEGKMISYFENGQIEEELEFITNFQNGFQINYNENGDTLYFAKFKRGKLLEVIIQ